MAIYQRSENRAEIARLTALAEVYKAAPVSEHRTRFDFAEREARHLAREIRRRAAAERQAAALAQARIAAAKSNMTAAQCFCLSFLFLGIACGLNTLQPCPLFVDAMMALMLFVVGSWGIVIVNNSMRVAALSR
jgi:hypothetical protein